ncbi:DUF6338 family protein [Palleronia caenipelagi]|uniref:Uncharacterized protein n=1 Tax=Palleronia caenipelagi TaxID=2489174 RepID=A0A547PY23_9RHOB|nr:DUF6338 family protein [Palleronia caenipelagi]TRD19006.1 hypothetical protein FEV53_10930 [Palleronia caenipelagi]
MNLALAQLALVFMPGIIWANVDAKYGAGQKPQQTTLIIRAFLFGIATYSALFLIYFLCGRDFGVTSLAGDSGKIDIVPLQDEIAWSIPLSFSLSVVWLWAVRYRLLMRFLHKIGATRRYGDEDVWSFTMNSVAPHVEYVHFRDIENGYIFAGWVSTYSENDDQRELLLREVIVYDEEGIEVTRTPHLYISRPKSNIWIEFPFEEGGQQDVKAETNKNGRDT